MNQWQVVIAAYGLVGLATLVLALSSYLAMRKAEGEGGTGRQPAERHSGDRPRAAAIFAAEAQRLHFDARFAHRTPDRDGDRKSSGRHGGGSQAFPAYRLGERPLLRDAPERPGEVHRSCIDASRAIRDGLWQPRTTLVEGLRRTALPA
jgi:hypothetical protein